MAVIPLLTVSCGYLREVTETPSDTRPPASVPAPIPAATRTVAPTVSPSDALEPAPTTPAISAPLRPALWPCCDNELGSLTMCYRPDAVLEEFPPNTVTIDLPVAEGTNLRSKWLEMRVQTGASTCAPDTPMGGGPMESVYVNGLEFLRSSGSDAGAGNVGQWAEHTRGRGDTCVRLKFVLHSGNPRMYDPPVPTLDFEAEWAIFDMILATYMEWG